MIHEDANSALPVGWANRAVSSVVDAKYGKSLPRRKRRGGETPVYGSNGVVGHHDEAITSAPVIIIGRKGSVGAVNYSDHAAWPIDTAYFIDDFRAFVPAFLRRAFLWLRLDEMDRSTAIPGLSREQLYERELLVPPLDEQRRIAVRLAEIEKSLGSIAARLQAARVIVERVRRTVLTAACRGRLTEAWREAHRDEDDASRKLERLREEYGQQRGRKITAPPDETNLSELPSSWGWASVGEVAAVQLGGTPSRKQPEYWGGSVPWVSSGEVANCRIASTRERITDRGLANSSAKRYAVGTVLIAMIGEGKTRGQSAILDIEACTNQNAAGIIVNRNVLDPEYVWHWARAEYETTRAVGRGGNQPALNGQKVRELALPVPPLPEQREIVKRADAILANADRLSAQIDRTALTLDRLPRASLAKAFRGELVPTEAALAEEEGRDYESANELLARTAAAPSSSRAARSAEETACVTPHPSARQLRVAQANGRDG